MTAKTRTEEVFEMLERGALRLVLIGFLVFLGFAIAGKVRAQEPKVSTGLACDKPEQVEKFLKSWDGTWQTTLQKVNAEEGEHACVVDTIAFIPGREIMRVEMSQGLFAVVEILVIAVNSPQGLARIEPLVWYAPFKLKDDRV